MLDDTPAQRASYSSVMSYSEVATEDLKTRTRLCRATSSFTRRKENQAAKSQAAKNQAAKLSGQVKRPKFQ
ncbi:hypothetical protein HYPSUDRAFT_47176 [Hypholoma sublateritium FD-334 SS-4]|uniref:Uncharacterized protein n=1 Tax=Hypholoma sublateritium (strain FD-334 SS-4) TaxID=945553 RepID=A0A0D2M0E8_HYPSF|nr:hypothetical protein HYPSUDRAFT_47176 [Hypholoma sublateritium FD-334 SS-4]